MYGYVFISVSLGHPGAKRTVSYLRDLKPVWSSYPFTKSHKSAAAAAAAQISGVVCRLAHNNDSKLLA
jgi:hypothetical protein